MLCRFTFSFHYLNIHVCVCVGYYAAVDGNLAILSLLTPFSQASAELAGDVTSRDCPGFVPAERGAHVLAQRGGGETAAEKKR